MSNTADRRVDAAPVESEAIPFALLERYGASLLSLDKHQILFEQGDAALFFYVLQSGSVKMSVYNDKGREFIQGTFTAGQSFGEPPFFCRSPYPATATAVEPGAVWRCGYEKFVRLLAENPQVHLLLTETLCRRLVYKSMMLSEIAVEEAEHRLRTIIEYFRKNDGGQSAPYRVPFTRQQLADMTGLRVETVIRTVKGMEEAGLLTIARGKIIWMPEDESG